MKKGIILLITLILLTGCGKKEKEIKEETSHEFVLEKIDKEKDYVYLEDFKTIKYNKKLEYKLQNCIINIKSDAVDNVNLELRNFVLNSYNSMDINTDYMNHGNIISYESFVTKDYVSVLQNYYFYMGNIDKDSDSNIYVIDLNTGKLLSNKDILSRYDYSEDKLYAYIKDNLDSDDLEFSLMQIKNDGYKLYINNDNKIVVVYKEELNDGIIKKELIID